MTSVLGPPFLVSTLPDAASHPQPDVRQQFFSDIETRRPTEISSAIQSLRLTNAQIPAMLHTMVKSLLGKVRCRTAGSRQDFARLQLHVLALQRASIPSKHCLNGGISGQQSYFG